MPGEKNNPYFVVGGFELFLSLIRSEPRILEAFKTGSGLSWGEHDHGLFVGTERFFKPGYIGNLVANWLPALDGVVARCRQVDKQPISAVGTGLQPLSWRRRSPILASGASTTMHPLSRRPGRKL